jgi:hypothetical protein
MIKVNRKQLINAIKKSLTQRYRKESKVLLKAFDNVLKVYSTNFVVYDDVESIQKFYHNYLSISININSKCNELTALVNKYSLLNLLESIKSDNVDLLIINDGIGDNLSISDSEASYLVKTYDPEPFMKEFIDIDNIDIKDGIIFNSKSLIKAINSVIYAINEDKVVYIKGKDTFDNPNILKSVGFVFENDFLFIVGTDNFRVVTCSLKILNHLNINGRFGITKTATTSLKWIFHSSQRVLFNIVEKDNIKMAVFKSGNIVFTTEIVRECTYPDFLSIINEDRKHVDIELKLSKKEKEDIINNLKIFLGKIEENEEEQKKKDILQLFSKPKPVFVKLTLENGNLNLLSLSDGKEADIKVKYKRVKYTITLNALFLLEALENMCSDDIVLKFPLKVLCGVFIEPVKLIDNCNCLALVMPLADSFHTL